MTNFERDLINAWIDGTLPAPDLPRLNTLLREDAEARRLLRSLCTVDAKLSELAAVPLVTPEVTRKEHSSEKAGIRSLWFAPVPLAFATMVLALFSFLAALMWRGANGAPRVIVELDEVAGVVNWMGTAGDVRGRLDRGARLSAGTLELEGEGSMARVRFPDGTRLALSGGAQAMISDDGRKRVHLHSGALLAEVNPQPAGRPMLVRTPTASVEVLGTVFSISALTDRSALNVEHGRVRFERVADGRVVEVSERQGAVASLDTSAPFAADAVYPPRREWREEFRAPPPARWRGEWLEADAAGPTRVRAVPCVAGRHDDGKLDVQHGITARGSGGPIVALDTGSVLSIRCRMEKPAPLRVMLSVNRFDGSFAGNFEATIPTDAGSNSPDGWRDVRVPLAKFHPLIAKYPLPPPDAGVSLVFVTTFQTDAALEVAELSITP